MTISGTIRTMALATGLMLGAAASAHASGFTYGSPVTINYWNGTLSCPGGVCDQANFGEYQDTGTAITFNQPPDSTDTVSAIPELRDVGGADSDPAWPLAGVVFGADITTTINVTHAGTYNILFGTDDAGYLYVDGTQIAALPYARGISSSVYSDFLTAGSHSVEIQYDNIFCCGAVVQFANAPEPQSWGLMIVGVAGVGALLRNARRKDEHFA